MAKVGGEGVVCQYPNCGGFPLNVRHRTLMTQHSSFCILLGKGNHFDEEVLGCHEFLAEKPLELSVLEGLVEEALAEARFLEALESTES